MLTDVEIPSFVLNPSFDMVGQRKRPIGAIDDHVTPMKTRIRPNDVLSAREISQLTEENDSMVIGNKCVPVSEWIGSIFARELFPDIDTNVEGKIKWICDKVFGYGAMKLGPDTVIEIQGYHMLVALTYMKKLEGQAPDLITKQNYRLMFVTCMIVAFKVHSDTYTYNCNFVFLLKIMDTSNREKDWSFYRDVITQTEWKIVEALDWNLYTPLDRLEDYIRKMD
jgi:hypothetical protein